MHKQGITFGQPTYTSPIYMNEPFDQFIIDQPMSEEGNISPQWTPPHHSPLPDFHVSGLSSAASNMRTPTNTENDPFPEDEDETTLGSDLSSKMVILPCTDFSRYSYWLKRYFPHLMHKPEINFIENILGIKSQHDVQKFC